MDNPWFEYLKDATDAGYIEEKLYDNDGIEMMAWIIIKPFHLKRGNNWSLNDEIGEPVFFGAWQITDKGREEKKRRAMSAQFSEILYWKKVEREEMRQSKC